MFKSLACAFTVAVANAWDMPTQLNGFVDPVVWDSYIGGDSMNNVAKIVADFNQGAMTAMQTNPDATTTTCYKKSKETSDKISGLFDTSNTAD